MRYLQLFIALRSVIQRLQKWIHIGLLRHLVTELRVADMRQMRLRRQMWRRHDIIDGIFETGRRK